VLSALRGPADGLGEAVKKRVGPPSLSLTALDELVDRVRLAGVLVQTEVAGDPVPLSADVDQAAARIVQEALTNVARHAAGERARVLVRYRPGPTWASLLIVVDNDGPVRPPAAEPEGKPGGRGISGMRERTQAFGGTFRAGPRPEGGFRVHAELPICPPAERGSP
jgi:signal transduction histidine kinase